MTAAHANPVSKLPSLSKREILIYQAAALVFAAATAGFFIWSTRTLDDTFGGSEFCSYEDPKNGGVYPAKEACLQGESNDITFPASTLNSTEISSYECTRMLNHFCTNYTTFLGLGLGFGALTFLMQIVAIFGLISACVRSKTTSSEARPLLPSAS